MVNEKTNPQRDNNKQTELWQIKKQYQTTPSEVDATLCLPSKVITIHQAIIWKQ